MLYGTAISLCHSKRHEENFTKKWVCTNIKGKHSPTTQIADMCLIFLLTLRTFNLRKFIQMKLSERLNIKALASLHMLNNSNLRMIFLKMEGSTWLVNNLPHHHHPCPTSSTEQSLF